MQITVDTEAKVLIEQFCDIALKMGGLPNLEAVNVVLSELKVIDTKPKEKVAHVPVKVEVTNPDKENDNG